MNNLVLKLNPKPACNYPGIIKNFNRISSSTEYSTINFPSTKTKRYICDLMPFNIQGNKSELLTKHIGGLIEHVAEKAKRIIDPFCGTACYIHYLRDEGIEYRPMLQTRHTFATLMIDAGEDIGWVQRMLGHGSLKELEVKN